MGFVVDFEDGYVRSVLSLRGREFLMSDRDKVSLDVYSIDLIVVFAGAGPYVR
jgi:hypothetical protein